MAARTRCACRTVWGGHRVWRRPLASQTYGSRTALIPMLRAGSAHTWPSKTSKPSGMLYETNWSGSDDCVAPYARSVPHTA
eukprot:3552110-Rhodomonas_salina.6